MEGGPCGPRAGTGPARNGTARHGPHGKSGTARARHDGPRAARGPGFLERGTKRHEARGPARGTARRHGPWHENKKYFYIFLHIKILNEQINIITKLYSY